MEHMEVLTLPLICFMTFWKFYSSSDKTFPQSAGNLQKFLQRITNNGDVSFVDVAENEGSTFIHKFKSSSLKLDLMSSSGVPEAKSMF